MTIHLISFWFPRTNNVGPVRIGRLAKYLLQAGHDIRVLAGLEIDDLTLPFEVPADGRSRVPTRCSTTKPRMPA